MSKHRTFITRLALSAGAGVAATLVDLGVLAALVSLAGVSPRAANLPALLIGDVVAFFGQKYLAFRSHTGRGGHEAVSFALVEGGGFLLNALLFDVAMRATPTALSHYVIVRLLVTNAVWLCYSFPLWHLVFKHRTPG